MELTEIKKQWTDYQTEYERSESMDIEKHISMALTVGSLISEIERLEQADKHVGINLKTVLADRTKEFEMLLRITKQSVKRKKLVEKYKEFNDFLG